MNSDTPIIEVHVKKEFLTDNDEIGFEKGFIFGASAQRHKALQFHVFLESGAVWWRLPIHALKTHEADENLPLEDCQLWAALDERIHVHEFLFLRRMGCSVLLRSGAVLNAMYRFTIDFFGHGSFADTPNEHKCAHILESDEGHLLAYPNNRIIWKDASLSKADAHKRGYKINKTEWLIDEDPNWNVSEDDRYFYHPDESPSP